METGILALKPERVVGFDPELESRCSGLIGSEGAALVEIAGRDSVVAGYLGADSGKYRFLIPTLVYTGTEWGDWNVVLDNVERLRKLLEGNPGVEVTEPVIMGSPSWWHALAGRFSGELFEKYGFPATCIACHMYLHSVRVPFSKAVGAEAIIGGERESHGGRLKINQLPGVIEAYREIVAEHGIELLTPLQEVREDDLIEKVAGDDWKESRRQLSCVLENNYRDLEGRFDPHPPRLEVFIEEYLLPAARKILALLEGGSASPDYLETVSGVLEPLLGRRIP